MNRTRFAEFSWTARRIYRLKFSYIAMLCLLILAQLGYTLDPLFIRWVINRNHLVANHAELFAVVSLFLMLAATRITLYAFGKYSENLVLQRFLARLRASVFKTTLSLHPSRAIKENQGDAIYKLEKDIENVGQLAIDAFPGVLRIGIYFLGMLVLMTYVNWRLALVAIAFLPIFIAIQVVTRRRFNQVADSSRKAEVERTKLEIDVLRGLLEIRFMRAERGFLRRFSLRSRDASRTALMTSLYEIRVTCASLITIAAATISVMSLGYFFLIHDQISLGGLTAFYFYLTGMFSPVTSMIERYSQIKRYGSSVRSLMATDIWHVNYNLYKHAPIHLDKRPLADVVDSVTFEGVDFGFDEGFSILRDVNLTFCGGSLVALTGSTGSGKTSLLYLLLGIYIPTNGLIRIDKCNIKDMSLPRLWSLVSFVPQHSSFFDGTIEENIRLVNPAISNTELNRFASISGFDSVLVKLKSGWREQLRSSDVALSTGEMQRLALLRALAQGRPIIILDEATSGLDIETEQRVLRLITSAFPSKIIIISSHRSETLNYCNSRIHIDSGHVYQFNS